jgi:hypothetical protein
MRLVDYRRLARGRRPLAIGTAIGLGLAVLTAAAVAATAVTDLFRLPAMSGRVAKTNLSPVGSAHNGRVDRRTSTSHSRRASSRPR